MMREILRSFKASGFASCRGKTTYESHSQFTTFTPRKQQLLKNCKMGSYD